MHFIMKRLYVLIVTALSIAACKSTYGNVVGNLEIHDNFQSQFVENRTVRVWTPENYDPERYELLLRLFEAQPDKRSLSDYFIWSMLPGRKTDINNKGAFSTDMIGMNYM